MIIVIIILLIFLKCILHEKPSSMIYKFLYLQLEHPTRGDWASSCLEDIKDLKIEMTFEAIKLISKNKFCKIIKKAIHTRALEYLLNKQGSKGQEIKYKELKMAEYLLPNYQNITIDEQRSIFALRNRMVIIP